MLGTLPQARIAYLDSFRLLMILFVVGQHSLSVFPTDLPWRNAVFTIVATIAVPGFFLVDGFLFALKCSGNRDFNYGGYVADSIKRLAVPWLIFGLLYFFLRWGFECAGYTGFDKILVLNTSIGQKLIVLYTSAEALQLYFLPALLLVRLCSFVTKRIVEIDLFWQIGIFIIFTCIISVTPVQPFFSIGLDPVKSALGEFKFYLLGIVLYSLRNHMFTKMRQVCLLSLVVMILSRMILFPLCDTLFQLFYLLFVYSLFQGGRDQPWNISNLGRHTMGIYLLHQPVVLHFIKKTVFLVFLPGLLSYALVTFTTFTVALLLYLFSRRLPFANYAFGDKRHSLP